MNIEKTKHIPEKLIDFTLWCKVCRKEHRTKGYKDNPPVKYCHGFQMRVIRPK
jgi:hypothetical protein